MAIKYEIMVQPYGGGFGLVVTHSYDNFPQQLGWYATLDEALERAASHAAAPLSIPLILYA
jgi:hypothetical protein